MIEETGNGLGEAFRSAAAMPPPFFPQALLARIMQEIRIRVDWGPEKMP